MKPKESAEKSGVLKQKNVKQVNKHFEAPNQGFTLTCSNLTWWLVFSAVLITTAATRYYKIDEPDHVCWDETHFGKMGSWYINHTFFFDVHPSLGKMLIGLAGQLTGYNGSFAFNKPGDKYGDHHYVGMRVFCVTLGGLIIPFSFLIVWEMTKSVLAAGLAASFITFDVGILTLSRYILLDPILMFFIIGSVLGMVKFQSYRLKSFTTPWWFWLCWTGTFLSCSISVKFVGLFVVLLVGLHTCVDLWDLLGDLQLPMREVTKHFLARAACLIMLPIALYAFFFYIHLRVLYKSGSGDGFFSSAFQSQLEGNSLYQATMPRELSYGAMVTLKNHRTGGGYLHSHWHLYPEGVGAKQQQVTTYSHKDENNKWIVKKFDRQPELDDPIELVRNGDLIRLQHIVTSRNLHGHREVAPVTKRHYQITCYGENGTGDANDVWKVEMIGGGDREVITAVTSRLRLIHYLSGCALHSHSKQLPKWGYEQMEVTCNPNVRDKNNLWNIEENVFAKLPNVSFEVYAPSFLEKFIESHAVMLQGNAGLKPKEGEVTSRPWQWPVNYRGQFFSGHQFRIYLLGNPLIWWGNLVLLAVYVALHLYVAICRQRGSVLTQQAQDRNKQFTSACGWLFVSWSLHYWPFYVMGRILYFHHYFPALLFSSMLSGVVIDYLLQTIPTVFPSTISKSIYHWLMGAVLSGTLYSFYLFYPLTYGMDGPSSNIENSTMHGLKWLESWEF